MRRPSISLGLPIGILDEIQLIPSQRGKGLATGALQNCITLCAERSCTGIILNAVPQKNCPIDLVAWYERHGFKIIGPSWLGQFMLLTLPERAAAGTSTN
jgi:GNAT superfamily N-acetyltransferase